MAGKHWLVRSGHPRWGQHYHLYKHIEPPTLGNGNSWYAQAGHENCWVEYDLKPGPDGSVYGRKLEPGGGPVDVSAWFPENGKNCTNCGNSREVTMTTCPWFARCIDASHWKPREPEHIASSAEGYSQMTAPPGGHRIHPTGGLFISSDPLGYDRFNTQPSIPGVGEGGSTMAKTRLFQVGLVDEPNEQQARELGHIGKLVYYGVIPARDEQSAIVKAMAALAADENAPKYDVDMIAATVAPFGG